MNKDNIIHALLDHCEVFQIDLDCEDHQNDTLMTVIRETREQILHVVKMMERDDA